LREEERALEVDVHDEVEVGFGDVPEVGAFFYAGVVDEDVAGTELLPGGVDERVAVGDAGDVGADHDGFPAGGVDFVGGGLGLLDVVAVVDDAVRAFLCEALGDGLADAGA